MHELSYKTMLQHPIPSKHTTNVGSARLPEITTGEVEKTLNKMKTKENSHC